MYRLKKWYPGLPKDWKPNEINVRPDIVVKLNGFGVYQKEDRTFKREDIENNPEFWEKVEKDYRILSLKGLINNKIHKIVNVKVCTLNGDYLMSWGTCNSLELIKKNPTKWAINSVKRFSDGGVFTVGDNAEAYSKIGVIIGFEIDKFNHSKIIVLLRRDKNSTLYKYHLQHIAHVKEPLFTTHDGVGIYLGDEYTFVTPSMSNVFDRQIAGRLSGKSKGWTFSTKEKAEQWVENNKKQWSNEDIKNVFKKLEKYPLRDLNWSVVMNKLYKGMKNENI